jgi:hypothetical protein
MAQLVQRRRGAIKEEESRQAEYEDAKRRDENRRGFLTWRLGGSPLPPSLARISLTLH